MEHSFLWAFGFGGLVFDLSTYRLVTRGKECACWSKQNPEDALLICGRSAGVHVGNSSQVDLWLGVRGCLEIRS